MKKTHRIPMIMAAALLLVCGYLLGKWVGVSETEQTPQNQQQGHRSETARADMQQTPVIANQTKKSMVIFGSENAGAQVASKPSKPELSKVPAIAASRDSEPGEEPENPFLFAHQKPLLDAQSLANFEEENESAREEFAASLRATGMPEEEIEQHAYAVIPPIGQQPIEEDLRDLTVEELKDEMEISLLEAGVPVEEIDQMVEGFFSTVQVEQGPLF